MAISTDAAAADAAKRKADADAQKAATAAEAEAQAAAPVDEEAAAKDPRTIAAKVESERQEREAASAKQAADARFVEPMKEPHPEVVELLGATAKPTGMLRIASVEGPSGTGKRLQQEWANGNKAAWFDVQSVLVASLPEPAPAREA